MTSAVERGKEIKALLEKEPGLTSREIAKKLNVSPGTVSLALKGLVNAEEVQGKRVGRGIGLHLTMNAKRRKLLSERWR